MKKDYNFLKEIFKKELILLKTTADDPFFQEGESRIFLEGAIDEYDNLLQKIIRGLKKEDAHFNRKKFLKEIYELIN